MKEETMYWLYDRIMLEIECWRFRRAERKYV